MKKSATESVFLMIGLDLFGQHDNAEKLRTEVFLLKQSLETDIEGLL